VEETLPKVVQQVALAVLLYNRPSAQVDHSNKPFFKRHCYRLSVFHMYIIYNS
jgi:hypothetical protein